jgi:hypothetical protein
MNIIFLFFNGGGLNDDQWFNHPYKHNKTWFDRPYEKPSTNLVKKIRKYGDTYLYTPTFYSTYQNIIDGAQFDLNDLDLVTHCEKIYEAIKKYKYIYIISHSRGWILSKFFCSLYSNQIIGYINLDGGESNQMCEQKLSEWKLKYGHIDDTHLKTLFKSIVEKQDKSSYGIISGLVQYHIYQQYHKLEYDYENIQMYVLNNIYNDDEINVSDCSYGKDTLLSKFNYCKQFEHMKNVNTSYYVGKTHFLYFYDDVAKDIVKIIENSTRVINEKQKLLFVMFGGYGMATELWNYDLVTMKQTNFLNKIKELGNVYCYYPPFYNIQFYMEKNNKVKEFYDNTIKFNLADIDYKTECQYIHDKINKKYKYEKVYIVCTSIGIHYAIELSKLLSNCSIISIEGSHVGKNAKLKFEKTLEQYDSKYKKYTNDDLQIMIKNEDYNEINNLISSKMISQIDFTFQKFGVPSLHFQNLIIGSDASEKISEKNMLKISTSNELIKHDDQYHVIWLTNKDHVAFGTDTENIIYHIKQFISIM